MNHDFLKKILVSEEEIEKRSKELGKQLSKDYEGKKPIFIGLLKGSVPFLAQIIKYVDIDMEIDFMDVSSYQGVASTEVKIIKDLDRSIQGRDIVIVEDIVDTGKTLKVVKELLYSKGASSIKIVTLLNKPEGRLVDIDVDYYGFNIPNEFVIGYGLDYNEYYRNLPYVGVLKEEVYQK